MTKLSAENLDNKRLNESRISKKIFKSMVNGNGSLGHEDDDNWDEASVRSQLGDEVVNDVDEYFSKIRGLDVRSNWRSLKFIILQKNAANSILNICCIRNRPTIRTNSCYGCKMDT